MELIGVASLVVAVISLSLLARQELRHKRIAGAYWGIEAIGTATEDGTDYDVLDLTLYGSQGAHLFAITQVGFEMDLNVLPDAQMRTGWAANSNVRIAVKVESDKPWVLIEWRPHHRTDMYVFSWLPLNIRNFDAVEKALRPAWTERLPLFMHKPKPVGPTGAMRLTLPARKQLQESEAEAIFQIANKSGPLRRWPIATQWRSKKPVEPKEVRRESN